MSESKVKDRFAEHRVVFKVPEYMSELREELMSLPENQWSKRILHLALIGLTVSKVGGAVNTAPATITPSKGAGKSPASTTKTAQTIAPEPYPVAAKEETLPVAAQAPSPALEAQVEALKPLTAGAVEHQDAASPPEIASPIEEVVKTEEEQSPQRSTESVGKRRNRLPTMPVMTQ